MNRHLAMLLLFTTAGSAGAQGWSAQLVLNPLPSPFLSDWELDPTIGQLIVTNPGSAATDVTFHYTASRNGRIVLRGTTDPQTIPGQQSVVFTGASTFGGRADWDRDVQQTIARTGKLPEGEYEACVTVTGPGNIVLVQRQCVRFTTQSADPPWLVSPANGDTVSTRDPIFEWLPVQVPAMSGARIGYVLQIAEVRTAAGQRPEVALESNILHYVEPHLTQTSHPYPVGALPLVSGRMYAWRVQALDGDGKPAATNQGRSEIWTFVYRETETEVERKIARVELTPRRDTLRFAGDTARYQVTAYDADNVEITAEKVQWRSLDTTVVQVDSSGVVRGVSAGETRVVASIHGVADSALSVMATTGLAVRFQRFDAATDKPKLLELLQSGSFEEVTSKLLEMLRSGEFVIPLPRLPGVERALAAPGPDTTALLHDDARRGGPSAAGSVTNRTSEEACNDVNFDVRDPYRDLDRKIFLFYLPLNRAQIGQVTNCLGVPNDTGHIEEAERLRGAMFVVSGSHPGVPRTLLIVKGIGVGFTIAGAVVDVRYLVANSSPDEVKIGSELLPPNFGGFFGDVEFDAGPGVTSYARRTCAASDTPLCRVVKWINPSNPVITVKAFAGVKESETTFELEREKTRTSGSNPDESKFKADLGHSTAFGFEISATLPVSIWDLDIGGLTLDSGQAGVEFAFEREKDKELGKETKDEDKVAPTLKLNAWFTGPGNARHGRNSWQVNVDLGVEAEEDGLDLVVALEIEQTWQLGPVRLGKPKVELKWPLPPREKPDAVEVELSGSWGFGENHGFGIADADKDPFAEVGSAGVTMKWRKYLTDTTETKKLEKSRASALDSVYKLDRVIANLTGDLNRALYASKADPQVVPESRRAAFIAEQAAAVAAADSALKRAKAERGKLFKDYEEADDLLDPHCWRKTKAGACISWSAKLGVNDHALLDAVAMAVRFITGLGNQ